MAEGKRGRGSRYRFFGRHTIMSPEGDRYMTRFWFWRLRLHIFHRGDLDPDAHDHPWWFWTFPLTPYVEEVVERVSPFPNRVVLTPEGPRFAPVEYARRWQVVPAFRPSFRPAKHTHRVLGAFKRYQTRSEAAADRHPGAPLPLVDLDRKIVTLVFVGKIENPWGFRKERNGVWCWMPWKKYLLEGGKEAPCE